MKEFEGTTSLLRLHSILYQEKLCAKGLKMMREMDNEINIVNFIYASALNCHQFIAYLLHGAECFLTS
jgi:hypothetical protein